MNTITKLELKREEFFPQLFAKESLTIVRVSATAFRFARFLWQTIEAGAGDRRAAWTDIQWQNYLSDPRCEFYAVYCDGEPAGCCEMVLEPRLMLARGGIVRLKTFGILPEYVDEGLGAALLTRMVEKGFATGASVISVQTSREMPVSMVTMMERQGFRLA